MLDPNYREIVRAARDDAPLRRARPPRYRDLAKLRKKPDDYPVGWNVGRPPKLGRGEVVAANLHDLRLLTRCIGVSEDTVEKHVSHEEQHAKAAGGEISYVLRFERERSRCGQGNVWWQLGMHATNWETTKLGVAAVMMHPLQPSEGDFDMLRAMGYEGMADVGARIVAHNAAAPELPLPVPYQFSQNAVIL